MRSPVYFDNNANDYQIIDFVDPDVELITPNGGELLPNNEYSTFSWEATDQFGIMENGINFELSTTHMPEFFNELVSGISNSYNTDILLPDVNTQYAKIKIIVFDSSLSPASEARISSAISAINLSG